jgi:flagellar protein FliT
MDIDSLLDPLTRALSQSQALLSLAQAGDWESFETLVQQRQQGLLSLNDQEYLQSLAQADLESKAAELIQEIQAINKQLAGLAEINRDNTASEMRQSNRANKAIDAYGR